MFATAADSVALGAGDDTQYADADGDGYGSAYGSRPEITNFTAIPNGGLWTLSGLVSDEDEDPTGWTVTFGGIIEETATVFYNDTFSVAVEIPDGEFGYITAQVTDSNGNTTIALFLVS